MKRRTTFDLSTRRGRQLFYQSALWRNFRKAFLRPTGGEPWCNRCPVEPAVDVHHVKPLAECSIEEALDPKNCEPLCKSCHGRARDW